MASSKKQPAVLIVGSVAFDSVETPIGSVERALGGSASYASLAASYFANPQVVAVVGEDFDQEHLDSFHQRGIDTSGIARVAGETFHWRGRYHEHMRDRETLETHLNVFEAFDPQLPEGFREASHVFLANIDPQIQSRVLDQVKNAKFVGMDTMNFWMDGAMDALKRVLKRVDIIFINDDEAFQLSGENQVLNAAGKILDLGPKYVVIKRGEFGSLLFGPDMRLFVPAVLLPKVVDPTGAGDTFAGGFLGYVSRAGSIDRSTLAQGLVWGPPRTRAAGDRCPPQAPREHAGLPVISAGIRPTLQPGSSINFPINASHGRMALAGVRGCVFAATMRSGELFAEKDGRTCYN
jgi:sugar/nucleoside kinase (ribokinase family)